MSPCRISTFAALVVSLLLAPPGLAEVRQIEAVGAYPLRAGAGDSPAPRDAAVRLALLEAVHRVALDLAPGLAPEEAAEYLPEALGNEPFEYATRFRIIENRREMPAMYSEDPEVTLEYVVVVEAHIDADRVEARLRDAGLIVAGAVDRTTYQLRVVVEELDQYVALAALRTLLVEGTGAASALPVEMERGRTELAVETSSSPEQLLEALLRAAPPELQITPLAVTGDGLRLRVAWEALSDGESSAPAGVPGASRRN